MIVLDFLKGADFLPATAFFDSEETKGVAVDCFACLAGYCCFTTFWITGVVVVLSSAKTAAGGVTILLPLELLRLSFLTLGFGILEVGEESIESLPGEWTPASLYAASKL